jgi:NADH-quinone oxidoreductase subunit N
MLNNINTIIDRHYMILVCVLLLFISFLFKLGLIPFHQWLPDVYEGSADPVTAYFSTVVKIPIVTVIITLISGPFMIYSEDLKFPFLFIGCLSMLFGTCAAFFQNSLKRILAYSSLNHFGLIICILPNPSFVNVQFIAIYLLIYSINMIGIFSIILTTIPLKEKNTSEFKENQNKKNHMDISDLCNKSNKNPYVGACLAIFFLSSAGIPPLGGFFSKYFILQAFVNQGLYIPCACIVISSLISAFYYIRLVSFCFFYDNSTFKFYSNTIEEENRNIVTKEEDESTVTIHKYESLLGYRITRTNSVIAATMALLNLILPFYIVPYVFTIAYL